MVEAGELLEWAEVFGNRYGTPRAYVDAELDAGHDVILEIDVQGAQQVRAQAPDALSDPPRAPHRSTSSAARLRGRGTESEERIAIRLEKADWELAQRGSFDHVVVNDELERCIVPGRCYHRYVPRRVLGRRARPHGGPFRMIEPKIDDLLAAVDSKYSLVILSAKRAREINSYYNQLGEGRGEFVPPLVETGFSNKPLSIALEEIAEGKIDVRALRGARGRVVPLAGRRVLLGVTGGIAAYKAALLARLLTGAGAQVTVVMTEAATRFVGPDTFAALTGNPVHTSLWERPGEVLHVRLAHEADLVVVAPATANLLARLAHGRRRRPADLDTPRVRGTARDGSRDAHGDVGRTRRRARTSRRSRPAGVRFVRSRRGPARARGRGDRARLAEPEEIVDGGRGRAPGRGDLGGPHESS